MILEIFLDGKDDIFKREVLLFKLTSGEEVIAQCERTHTNPLFKNVKAFMVTNSMVLNNGVFEPWMKMVNDPKRDNELMLPVGALMGFFREREIDPVILEHFKEKIV